MHPPFSRYSITEDGVVYSLIKRKPYMMKPYLDKDGYHRVSIMTDDTKKKKKVIISRKVYETYGDKSVQGLVVRHLDGNKNNNHISNLDVGTVLENNKDKQKHGTQCRGESSGLAKLKEKDIPFIRDRSTPIKVLMEKYSISKPLVDKIRARSIWKHI